MAKFKIGDEVILISKFDGLDAGSVVQIIGGSNGFYDYLTIVLSSPTLDRRGGDWTGKQWYVNERYMKPQVLSPFEQSVRDYISRELQL